MGELIDLTNIPHMQSVRIFVENAAQVSKGCEFEYNFAVRTGFWAGRAGRGWGGIAGGDSEARVHADPIPRRQPYSLSMLCSWL